MKTNLTSHPLQAVLDSFFIWNIFVPTIPESRSSPVIPICNFEDVFHISVLSLHHHNNTQRISRPAKEVLGSRDGRTEA